VCLEEGGEGGGGRVSSGRRGERGGGESELWLRRARVGVVSTQVMGLVVAGFGLGVV